MHSLDRSASPLSRLCRYYLACLARDVDRKLSAFASNHRGPTDYVELPQLAGLPDTSDELWAGSAVRQLLTRFRKERQQRALYVGYPVRLVYVRGRSGWEGFRVEPLLVFELGFERDDPHPTLLDARPDVNLNALGSLSGVERTEVLDESLALQAELGLDAGEVDADDLEDLLSRLPEVRPQWPWREDLCSSQLNEEPPISELQTEGLYNRAILLTSERSRFTRGLENELRELEATLQSDYGSTALGRWIDPTRSSAEKRPQKSTFLELFPLNIEQRHVVQQALTRPLTVVTGPPGTGKSQVVASIVANCAWRGEKVLVASKNNKAVDVVEERVNAFGPRPLLLRLGSNQYQTRLAEYLSTLLSATADSSDEAGFNQALVDYKNMRYERDEAIGQLDEIVHSRNELDELEQQVESIRNYLGPEVFARTRDLDFDRIATLVTNAERTAQRASRAQHGLLLRLIWPLLRSQRLDEACHAVREVEDVNRALALPDFPLDADDGVPLLDATARLRERLNLAEQTHVYFSALKHLNGMPSTSEITRDVMHIGARLQKACSRLWNLWLKLQPARLNSFERRLLGDYKALLEMRIAADDRGERVGGKVFRSFMQMFPQLTGLLPAWAVTNLSARGRIPLEAGFFDLVVIDEASQCDIASALPLLYRSKRAVIIGDPKQLRHITQISERINYALLNQNGIDEIGLRWSYTGNSLFDLAATLTDQEDKVELRDHHRSASAIIGFANKHFYEDRLRVATKFDHLRVPSGNDSAIRWANVQGTVQRPRAGSAVNDSEAVAIVEELVHLLVECDYQGSVGVVTPFRAQANRIRELVHQNEQVMRLIGPRELIVDTVYKFQGDERDVILFSPVVSNDTPRSTLQFLESNANTFNVAITRARAGLITVGDLSACSSCGVPHLEAFARYVANGLPSGANSHIPDATDLGPTYPPVGDPEQVSEWERWFYGVLYRDSIRPIPQFSVEQYRLDFALFNGERKLAIEIDGEYYHRTWSGELARRDQIRNGRLIELGWDVMRFWVYQIRDDTDYCVQKIRSWYHATS